ncbi:Alpha/Beta hydrolase protein [Aspergillus cavernicola]|uniref:Alpha/Beta hydrolase protein n=1 Tax=Aspergillus cavernicola TaxID=176166 RepID=A0ABR4IJS2_9EURO
MENFQHKELVTRRSLKYTYYISSSEQPTTQSPALLFLHGFPDSAHLWTGVVAKLGDLPNKIIIPDCLGYAGTDKPTDTDLYAYKDQAEDLADILGNEHVKSTIIIGHDWGSALAQRTYLHKPELFSGIILLNTGYMVPSTEPFDLAAINSLTEKIFGYQQFSYWDLFLAPDAPDIVENNLDRMWQVLHGDVENWMKKLFCIPNAMREFLLGSDEVPLKDYAKNPAWKDRFMQQFKTSGDLVSALQMYKATQTKSDATIPKEDLGINVPLLFISCSQDAVCKPEVMNAAKDQGLVPFLKEAMIDCAHWSPMERPDEIAWHVREFLGGVGFSQFNLVGPPVDPALLMNCTT